MELKIDPEFQRLLMPLTADEYAQLERNILKNGCLDPLKVGRGKLASTPLDGHNRYEICTRHGIKFEIERLNIEDRKEAHDWIINNQLGRRNVTLEQASYLRGKRYNAEKASVSNRDGRNQHSEVNGQNVHQPTTADKLAIEYNVDEKTIRRDAKFADALDTIASNAGDEARRAILSPDTKITKQDVINIANKPPEFQKKVAEVIKNGKATSGTDAIREVLRAEAKEAGLTPQQEVATDLGVGWYKNLHKHWVFYNSLRDHGGIAKLSRKWTEELKRNFLTELRKIRDCMNECIEYLERELSK